MTAPDPAAFRWGPQADAARAERPELLSMVDRGAGAAARTAARAYTDHVDERLGAQLQALARAAGAVAPDTMVMAQLLTDRGARLDYPAPRPLEPIEELAADTYRQVAAVDPPKLMVPLDVVLDLVAPDWRGPGGG